MGDISEAAKVAARSIWDVEAKCYADCESMINNRLRCRSDNDGEDYCYHQADIIQQAIASETAGLCRQLAEAKARENAIWKHCRVIFYPADAIDYPIEHAPHANKDSREAIEKAISETEAGRGNF